MDMVGEDLLNHAQKVTEGRKSHHAGILTVCYGLLEAKYKLDCLMILTALL